MKKPRLILIKTGQAVPEAQIQFGDFEHWFIDGLGIDAFDYDVVQVDRGDPLPPAEDVHPSTAVLITGSPAMVSHRADWAEKTAAWLAERHEHGNPMLGVCFGHQLLAHALGGAVGPNPRGRRMGRVPVERRAHDDALLTGLEQPLAFNVSHVEVVQEPPPGARVTATAAHDPHHALHFGGQTWGVQFHPEFDGAITRAYIEARRELLLAEGQTPEQLIDELDMSAEARQAGHNVLARFAQLAGGRSSTSGAVPPGVSMCDPQAPQ